MYESQVRTILKYQLGTADETYDRNKLSAHGWELVAVVDTSTIHSDDGSVAEFYKRSVPEEPTNSITDAFIKWLRR